MPPTFTPNIQWTLLKILDQILINLRLRGYHPLRPVHSNTSSTSPTRTLNQELLHHIFTPITRGNSVYPMPCSLDVTNGIAIAFFSSAY